MSSGIRASSGVRSPLRLLQTWQEVTRFAANVRPPRDFGKVGEAFGAYGEKVTDPAAVPAAIARAGKEVRGGRTAVLHVRVTKM